MLQKNDSAFFIVAHVALILTLLVILAGSVVRVTQSGMGCPDWPRCFGYYVPPTEEFEVRYRPGYGYKSGMMVIERDTLWRASSDFVSGPSFDSANWEKYPKHNYATFIVYQTWVEYINRLLGALLGLVIFVLAVLSLKFRTTNPIRIIYSAALILLTGFQAWLGKLVVDGNLIPQSISIHMLAALLILWVLLLILYGKSGKSGGQGNSRISTLALILMVLTILQILIGSQVREEIDEIALITGYSDRSTWIDSLSSIFALHKIFSIAVVGLGFFLMFQVKQASKSFIRKFVNAIGLVVSAEVMFGFVMAYFEVPRVAQSLHLLFATILFCLASRVYLSTRSSFISS
jgi:cytochrome c oxidase assembly protein subunit 15